MIHYIRYYLYKIKNYIKRYFISCKCDEINKEIDILKHKLEKIEKNINITKKKHVIKHGRIELHDDI